MVVIKLSKKKSRNNFYYINAMDRKKSNNGKIIKRIGFYDPFINLKIKFYIDYKILFYFIKNGAKLSKRIFEMLNYD